MKLRLLFKVLPIVLLFGSNLVSQVEKASGVEALKQYVLEKDYSEVFKDNHYHVRIENVLHVDIDNDGKDELVVQFLPHYRQSASVAIYRVSPESGITRVTEGLAPGPVEKISGDYLDSHETGQAVDFTLGDGQDKPSNVDEALQVAFAKFGGVVAYRGFFHADGRGGPLSYIDMTNVQLPSNANDCSSFEFSTVRQIAAGHLREDSSRNYLAAWVRDEIYVYLIKGISSRGLLDKQLRVVKAPV